MPGRSLLNLAVELDERFDERIRAECVAALEASGLTIEEHDSAPDGTLSWIDLVFGGTWSIEAKSGANAVVRKDAVPVAFATYDARNLRYRWLRKLGSREGVGIFGPFGVAPELRGTGVGPVLLAIALCGLRRRGYATALIPAVGDERLAAYYMENSGARIVERYDRVSWARKRTRVVVMASGAGTNLAALAKSVTQGWLPLEIAAVVTSKRNAGVVERAQDAGIPVLPVVWDKERETRADYDARLFAAVSEFHADLILLLGWMHVLDPTFVRGVAEILNLHPAFMPLDPDHDEVGMPDGTTIPVFRGSHAVRDAVRSGAGWIGASVHRVTPDVDRGPVIMRTPLKLRQGEDERSAYDRLRPLERVLVPRAITAWAYQH